MDNEMLIKILLVGDTSVGKADFLERIFGEETNEKQLSTINLNYKFKHMNIDNTPIKLQIWNCDGQEHYHTIQKSFAKGVDAMLMVFDFANQNTFAMVERWINSAMENEIKNADIFLIGNNCDQEKVVPQDKINTLQNRYNLKYFEVSGKTGLNVEESLFEITKFIKDRKENEEKQELHVEAPTHEKHSKKDESIKELCIVS